MTRPTLKVTRDQLRAFIGDDFRTIKQFENLFSEVDSIDGEYLPISGGTLTGQLIIDYGQDNDPGLIINSQATSGDFVRYVNSDGLQVGLIGTDSSNGIQVDYGQVFSLTDNALELNAEQGNFNVIGNKKLSDPGLWLSYDGLSDVLELDANSITLTAPSDSSLLSAHPSGTVDLAIASIKYVNDNDHWIRTGTLITPEAPADDVEWNFINYLDATTGQTNSYRIGSSVLGGQDTYLYGREVGATSVANSVLIGEQILDSATGSNSSCFIIGSGIAQNYSGTGNLFAMGQNCLQDLTTGYDIVAIGSQAGVDLTTAYGCIAIGNNAFFESTSPTYSIAIGNNALTDINGTDVIGIGRDAGKVAGVGQTNDYTINIGYRAGSFAYGDNSVFIGKNAGYNSGTQDNRLFIANSSSSTLIYGEFDNKVLTFDCTADNATLTAHPTGGTPLAIATTQYVDDGDFWARNGTTLNPDTSTDQVEWDEFKYQNATTGGTDCLFIGATNNTTNSGNYIFALGADALASNTSGNGNTGIGRRALEDNTIGNDNTALGYQTLRRNISGYSNMAIGLDSQFSNTTGYHNVGIGVRSLYAKTTGYGNVAIGHRSGDQATGSRNLFLGYQSGRFASGSDQLYIANSSTSTPLIYGDFSASEIKINGSHEITDSIRTSAVETITASSDTLDDTNHIVLCDASSNNITINLPAASGNTGLTYNIKKIDSSGNTVTIDGNSSETIDGSTTAVISTQYVCLTIVCDGSNWHII